MDPKKRNVNFSNVQVYPRYVMTTIHVTSDSSGWSSNPETDRIELVNDRGVVVSQDILSRISEWKDNCLTVKISSGCGSKYKLVYVDENNSVRGYSSSFTLVKPDDTTNDSSHLDSSGSFETVSDDDQSFTVINGDELSISKNWEITNTASSTSASDDDSGDESDQSDNSTEEVNHFPKPKVKSESQLLKDTCSPELKVSGLMPTLEMPHIVNKSGDSSSEDEENAVIHNIHQSPRGQMTSNLLTTVGMSGGVTPAVKDDENKEETEETCISSTGAGSMSKSVILSEERLSHNEVKSLQTRNRAHLKKINKLSELLDNEKKATSQLIEMVENKTAENMVLVETIRKLRNELDETKKLLKRKKRECDEKDSLIASLKTSLRKDIQDPITTARRKDEQVLLRSASTEHNSTSNNSRRSPLPVKDYTNESGNRRDDLDAVDKTCDIGIVRLDKTHRQHHHYKPSAAEFKERDTKRRHERQSGRGYRRHSGGGTDRSQISSRRQQEQSRSSSNNIHSTAKNQQSMDYLCPVCNRQMPSSLTEIQMTHHVESCLKKMEA